MNDFCRCTSARIQPAEFKHVFENGAMSQSPPWNKKENNMLRKLAAALVATALIAGPAFAQSNGTSAAMPSAPAAQTAPAAPMASAAGSQADRQDNEGGQACGKACPQSCLADQKEHRKASGAPCQAQQDASRRRCEIRQAVVIERDCLRSGICNPIKAANRGPDRMHRLADARRRKPSPPQAGL